jgi:hypothetical protein
VKIDSSRFQLFLEIGIAPVVRGFSFQPAQKRERDREPQGGDFSRREEFPERLGHLRDAAGIGRLDVWGYAIIGLRGRSDTLAGVHCGLL